MNPGPAVHEVALFPLHAVLFPGGTLPLRVFEPRYMRMASGCLRDDKPFGVCLIREGSEVGAPAVPAALGCLARIVHWDMQQLGVLKITARGERRFRVLRRHVQADGLACAEVEVLPEETDADLPARFGACAELLRGVLEETGPATGEPRFASSVWVSARLAERLPLALALKQNLLEMNDGLERLQELHRILAVENLLPSG